MSEVSRLELELLALGELDADAEAALRARIASDGDLAGRYARIRREVTSGPALPALVLVDEVPAAPPSPARWPRWASLGGLGAVLAAAAAMVWLRPGPSGEVFRGGVDLEIVRIRDGVAEPQGALIRGRAGDRLQYTVTVANDGFVSVFDVQDDGVVSYWTDARAVKAGGSVSGAVRLDDYPGLERMWVVVSDQPLPTGVFERAVRDAWSRPLAEIDALPGLRDVTQRSVMIVEEP